MFILFIYINLFATFAKVIRLSLFDDANIPIILV
nr:MAG TPA: hypothetical protein [Caudoviricetes sp.]